MQSLSKSSVINDGQLKMDTVRVSKSFIIPYLNLKQNYIRGNIV